MIDKIQKCKRCSARKTCTQVIAGKGSLKAKIMVVTEYPNAEEDVEDAVLSGRVGKFFDMILRSSNLSRSDLYITHAVKCKPQQKTGPTEESINACKVWLWHEIKEVKPGVIITLGKLPASILLKADPKKIKMSEFVDRPLDVPYLGTKVICCYHPAYYLRRPNDGVRQVFLNVLRKARESVS